MTTNKNVLLTKYKNTLYVHLYKTPEGNVVKLRPLTRVPKSTILLKDGRKVDFEVVFTTQDHLGKKAYLRLVNLPVSEMCNTVPVIKLKFDRALVDFVLANFELKSIRKKQK